MAAMGPPALGWLLALAGTAAAGPMRLRIKNGCGSEPIWIANEAAAGSTLGRQNTKIMPNQFLDFVTNDGVQAARYWPKMGCNAQGHKCILGSSGGPGEACVRRPPVVPFDDYSFCAPPVDTKFEASFGTSGQPCDPNVPGGVAMSGCDYIDISLVDGFTLPFKLEINGKCSGKDDANVGTIDCSGLNFNSCPASERLGPWTTNLKAINPYTHTVAGCYAPCKKLTDRKWNNTFAIGKTRDQPAVAPYCCTAPMTAEACRAGPIQSTGFLNAVHSMCPGVYGYAFDDGMGLMRCTSGTQYVLTFFCPSTPLRPPQAARPPAPAAGPARISALEMDRAAPIY